MQYKENGSAPLLSETPIRLLLPPVCPCVPPWRQDGIRNPGGAEQGRVGAVCPALARCLGSHPRPVCAPSPERFAPPMREKWTVEKSAGESPGAFVAPGRSLPPAVRAVSGDGGWRFFGRATIRLTLIMRKETENPVVVGFLMALIPD